MIQTIALYILQGIIFLYGIWEIVFIAALFMIFIYIGISILLLLFMLWRKAIGAPEIKWYNYPKSIQDLYE